MQDWGISLLLESTKKIRTKNYNIKIKIKVVDC